MRHTGPCGVGRSYRMHSFTVLYVCAKVQSNLECVAIPYLYIAYIDTRLCQSKAMSVRLLLHCLKSAECGWENARQHGAIRGPAIALTTHAAPVLRQSNLYRFLNSFSYERAQGGPQPLVKVRVMLDHAAHHLISGVPADTVA